MKNWHASSGRPLLVARPGGEILLQSLQSMEVLFKDLLGTPIGNSSQHAQIVAVTCPMLFAYGAYGAYGASAICSKVS